MQKSKKLANTVIIYFIVLMISIVGTYAVSTYVHQRKLLLNDYGKRAQVSAKYIATTFKERGEIPTLIKYAETLSPDKKAVEMINRLTNYKNAVELAYLYVFIIRDGDLIFLLDTISPDITYTTGNHETMDAKNYKLASQIFATGTYDDSYEVVNDPRYGSLVTAYGPIYDEHGKLVALVGADYRTSWIFAQLNQFMILSTTQTSLLMAAFVLSGFLLIYRRILMPIESLAATMRKYALSGYEKGSNDYLATIWRNNEIGQLANNYNHMVLQMDEYVTKLRKSIADRIRSEGDLNAARAIQQGILPKILPPDEAMPNIFAAGEVLPARGVGGDLFDTFALDEDHLGIIIGDVSGKGIPAALFMAITQTLQRSLARRGMDPGAMASKLNRILSSQNDTEMFVTWWFGILDTITGQLIFTNAGHNHPFIKHADGTVEEVADSHGPPIAIVRDGVYSFSSMYLRDGDTIVLYTDGVTEAFRPDDEMFLTARLEACLNDLSSTSPDEILKYIEKTVFEFTEGREQSDDLTLLAVQYSQSN